MTRQTNTIMDNDMLSFLFKKGLVVVPISPTREMTNAAEKMGCGEAYAEDVYLAMIKVFYESNGDFQNV